ncbi:hypothetical protein BN1723_004911 [Verticillium longisporum]|uniref:Uncharacterized protein n=1 Tax=Verticillium longisporum TaxID=100787 RepID=A0A0G4N2I1_VERLO|nr:hypothetical protein BN1723_004911 [Verticillium longisporum]
MIHLDYDARNRLHLNRQTSAAPTATAATALLSRTLETVLARARLTAQPRQLAHSNIPYSYNLYGKNNVKARVYGTAGQTLGF